MEEPAVQSTKPGATDFFLGKNVSCQAAWQVNLFRRHFFRLCLYIVAQVFVFAALIARGLKKSVACYRMQPDFCVPRTLHP